LSVIEPSITVSHVGLSRNFKKLAKLVASTLSPCHSNIHDQAATILSKLMRLQTAVIYEAEWFWHYKV